MSGHKVQSSSSFGVYDLLHILFKTYLVLFGLPVKVHVNWKEF